MGSVYRILEFAERIGRSASTVRRWETEGRIVARRTPSGQRYFDDSDVATVLTPGFRWKPSASAEDSPSTTGSAKSAAA